MARYALVRDGKVENIAEWAGNVAWDPGEGVTRVRSDTAQIGDHYDGSTFSTPPVVLSVPDSVTPVQIRKAIRQSGIAAQVATYHAQVETAATAGDAAAIDALEAWEYASEVRRNNALIAAAAAGMGLTEAQTDGLFRLAATL